MRIENGLLALALAALAVAAVFFLYPKPSKEIGVLGGVHEHADFKLYLNGAAYNFSQEKFMSEKPGADNKSRALSNFVHLHDGDGEIIHKHASGVTLGFFFKSLKINFNSTCLVFDSGESFCNEGDKKIKLFVNGRPTAEFENYEINDLDRILISYGNEAQGREQLQAQINSVFDRACIQSGKCPERGKPGDESSCTTQGGCLPEAS